MRTWIYACLTAFFACAILAGCGGTNSSTLASSAGAGYNGIYRTSFTRGNSALTVYINYPEVEVVVTDESGAYPSYVGSSSTTSSVASGTLTFTAFPLVGSDGESAEVSGTLAASSSGSGNAINLTITGGLGFSGQVPFATSTTNSLYVGTYTGTYQSTYVLGSSTTAQPAQTVNSFTLTADSTTGGYDLNATGSTIDPRGNGVQFTISNAQVDPCGVISNLSVIYTYSSEGTASVTTPFVSAYLNLGVVSSTSLTGYFSASTSNWPNGALETDILRLSQTSSVPAKLPKR